MSPVRFLVAPHKKALQKCRAFLVCGSSPAPSVHKKGVFCGGVVRVGPFCPQKGCLLWMHCSLWPLPSTKRVSFVEELDFLAPFVHARGILCGGNAFQNAFLSTKQMRLVDRTYWEYPYALTVYLRFVQRSTTFILYYNMS